MPGRKRRSAGPMDEENLPDRSPTRDAVEKEMDEPSNLSGTHRPAAGERPPRHETEDE